MDHQITESGRNESNYKCGMCNSKFQNQQELGLHLTARHNCEICDKVFNQYGAKKTHLENVHGKISKRFNEEKKLFACDSVTKCNLGNLNPGSHDNWKVWCI